jgi:hypothetical protein
MILLTTIFHVVCNWISRSGMVNWLSLSWSLHPGFMSKNWMRISVNIMKIYLHQRLQSFLKSWIKCFFAGNVLKRITGLPVPGDRLLIFLRVSEFCPNLSCTSLFSDRNCMFWLDKLLFHSGMTLVLHYSQLYMMSSCLSAIYYLNKHISVIIYS